MTTQDHSGDHGDAFVVERFSDGAASNKLKPLGYEEMLDRRGRRVSGRSEVGFERVAVFPALAALRARGASIRRCEIVQSHFQSSEVMTSSHRIDRSVGEDDDHFFRRSHMETEEFIRRFADPEDGTILYVLAFDEPGGAAARTKAA